MYKMRYPIGTQNFASCNAQKTIPINLMVLSEFVFYNSDPLYQNRVQLL
jgi:hypothetical protein